MNEGEGFSCQTYTAPAERTRRWADRMTGLCKNSRVTARSILDVGCGTGGVLAALLEAFPGAAVTGIDISPGNIAAAQTRLAHSPATLLCCDYLAAPAQPHELVVSDSTLQLIPGETAMLLARLDADCAPGGIIACTVPYLCRSNRLLWGTRRLLRALRCRLIDGLILAAARLRHGRRWTRDELRERVAYMYLLPHRLAGDLDAGLHALGYERVACEAEPHAGLGQPQHRFLAWRKPAEP